jgi:hypothetical protein
MKAMKIALLYEVHVWSDDIASQFRQLSHIDGIDPWLLVDSRMARSRAAAEHYSSNCFVFEVSKIFDLPYSKITDSPQSFPIGHAHFPVLAFFLEHQDYDYVWFIEYDVRYTDDWNNLFKRFSRYNHDFITSHIRYFNEEPYWGWWTTLHHPHKNIPPEKKLRSFNVIYRISARALRFLDCVLRDGWRGHHEALLATLLYYYNFNLLDFGGSGSFTLPELYNQTYISCDSVYGDLNDRTNIATLCWRPATLSAGTKKAKLYHPVKPASYFAEHGKLKVGGI